MNPESQEHDTQPNATSSISITTDTFEVFCAMLDAQGRIKAVNEAWAKGVGRYPLLLSVGSRFPDGLSTVSSSNKVRKGLQDVLEGRIRNFTIDMECQTTSEPQWFRLTASAGPKTQGGASVTVFDITQRRRTEAALHESEKQYRRAAHAMQNSAMCTLDLDGRIATWNLEAERITGFHGKDIVGHDLSDLFPEEERQAGVPEKAIRIASTGETFEHRGSRLRADGMRFDARTQVSTILDADGGLSGFLLQTRDLSDDASMHPAVRSDYRRLLSIIDSAMDAVITVDDEQHIVTFNQAACNVFGLSAEEAMGSPLNRFIPESFRDGHEEQVRTFGQTGVTSREMGRLGTVTGLRADGTEFPVEASISHAVSDGRRFYTVILRDISEKRRLQTQLVQSQKMEGIGRLAGGVAHDFNNLLMGIFNYLMIASRKLEHDHPAQEPLRHVKEAADRAASLTRQLLIFARKQVVKPKVLAPADVVTGLEPMLHRLIGEDITLQTVMAPDTGNVRADSSQLEQIIMNLAVNARDAMPQGGTLTIETKNLRLDHAYCKNRIGASPGPHVMLAVTDTGHGMTPQVLSRLFEPFFTTKPEGKGTGLGLATCHGIVEQSNGHIAIYSEPNHGTCVKVFLPQVIDRVEGAAIDESASSKPPGGIETVLLVEDNAMVRDLAASALREGGYHLLIADNGLQALQVANQNPRPIDLLITDVVMPELGGVGLAQKLQQDHPRLRVIYMSGYTDETITDHGVETGAATFLAKPFMTSELLIKIREVLDAG